MSDSAPIGSYIPLRGDELKKVVLAKFSSMLGDFPAWSAGIAHINPEVTMEFHIKTHPYDPGRELRLEASLRLETHKADPPDGNTEIPKVERKLEHKDTIRDADKAREEANLVLPSKQETADGQIVDHLGDAFGEFDPGQGGPAGADKSSPGSSE